MLDVMSVEPSRDEIYLELGKSNGYMRSHREIGETTHVTNDHADMRTLTQIEHFVDSVIKTDCQGFHIRSDGTISKTPLSRYFGRLNSFFAAFSPNLVYSEEVRVFYEAFFDSNLSSMDTCYWLSSVTSIEASHFNRLVEQIRILADTEEFKDRLARRKQAARRNQRNYQHYAKRLFERYSRLLVIRMDLYYKPPFGNVPYLATVKSDIERLLNNARRNSLFKHMVGHICKLEWGEQGKGHHYHLILFYDGSKVRKDGFIGMEVGKYWEKQITGGRGAFYCVNCHKSDARRRIEGKFDALGIGMISHDDYEAVDSLMYVISYLCKSSQHLRAKTHSKMKTLRRGNLPRNKSNSGRRRRRPAASPDYHLLG